MFYKKGVVGVSVRDDVVRVLQFACTRRHCRVHAFGTAPLPKGAVEDAAVADAAALGAALRRACATAAPHAIAPHARAVCALPEAKTFLRIMTLPRMPREQYAEAVRWEIEGYVPLSRDDIYYDWQRVSVLEGRDHAKSAVMVVASARSVVDGYVAALRHAQLRPVALEADSIADTRALITPEAARDAARMILFCGDLSSRIAIVVRGVPIFAVSVPVGRATLIADITRALGVHATEAERIFSADGIGAFITGDPLFGAVAPSLQLLAGEVRKSVQFCLQALAQCRTVAEVLLCGRGARIRGLRAFLVRETGMRVVVADPWATVAYAPHTLPPLTRTAALDAVTVIGLAARTLSYEDFD